MKLEVARPIGQVLIAVALFLVLVPLANVGFQVMPFRPGSQSWRFGAWGYLLGAITLPTLGIGLLGLGGVLRDSISVVRVALVVSSLFLLFVLVGLADFLIEGSALRAAATDPKIRTIATVEIQRTVVISSVAIPALAAVAIGCYRMVRGMKAEISSREGSGPLVRAGSR